MIPNIFLLIFGVVIVTLGVLLIRFRNALAKANADNLRAFMGSPGARAARGSTPGISIASGGVAIFIGIVTIIFSFVPQH